MSTKTQVYCAEAFPHDVWAPEIIGATVGTLVSEMETKAEKMGEVPDWTTFEFRARDDETFGMVLATATVDLLP